MRAQVLEWTQTMLAAGEAFCGSESATLLRRAAAPVGPLLRRLPLRQPAGAGPQEPVLSHNTCRPPLHLGFLQLNMGDMQENFLHWADKLLLWLNESQKSPPKYGREKQHALLVLTILPVIEALYNNPLLLALQTLHAMLEREVWRRLPLVSRPLPSVLAALEGGAAAAPATAFDAGDFGAWVARGNPWRAPAHEDGEDGEAAGGLETLGPETLEGAGAGAEREDDEEAAELMASRSTRRARGSGSGRAHRGTATTARPY